MANIEAEVNIDSFALGVTLGTGSFGRVRFCNYKENDQIYALKMLKKSEVVRLQQVEHMISERSILIGLNHPFIVNLAATFQDPKHLYMVLEYVMGGELFTHLRKAGRFDHPTAKFYSASVVAIFDYLHSMDVIYRDLKPENLLFDSEGYMKMTDFGFAKVVTFKTYTLCGTPEYIAPEVLLNKGHGKGVDWWTLGVLTFEMLTGQPPFVDDDPMGIYQLILNGKVNFPRYIEHNAKSLLKKILVADLTKRFGCRTNGVQDIKKHKWFSDLNWDKLLSRQYTGKRVIPQLSNAEDTSNFDTYPDSEEETSMPEYSGTDPFIQWDLDQGADVDE